MNWEGKTAICYARSAEVMKLFIDAGADLQIKDINGKTQLDRALETACEQGNLEALEFLQSL
jgi:ankyrin repeat protein